MIFVDRKARLEPPVFSSKRMDAWRAEARERMLDKDGRQGKTKRNTKFYGPVRPALHQLFHHKCAYCETPLAANRHGDIELFRPISRAINLDGKMAPGYKWLAFEWSNFYLACEPCNRTYKRNRFPVRGPRTQYGENVEDEDALLLDPCLPRDFDELHFYYVENPTLEEVRMEPETERGKITIEILGLNRAELRRRRFEERQPFAKLLEQSVVNTAAPAQPTIERGIRNSLAPDSPFLGMKRAQAEMFFQTHGEALDARFPGLIASLRLAAMARPLDPAFSLSVESIEDDLPVDEESYRSPGAPSPDGSGEESPKTSAAFRRTKKARPSKPVRAKRSARPRPKAGVASPKAEASIHVFALQRKGLVDARKEAALELTLQFETVSDAAFDLKEAIESADNARINRRERQFSRELDRLKSRMAPTAAYLGLKRQLVHNAQTEGQLDDLVALGMNPSDLLTVQE